MIDEIACLKYCKVREEAIEPKYDHKGDSGFGLYSCVDAILYPHETRLIPTGLKFRIPHGYEIQCRSRSGMANKGIVVAQGIGTVDEPYRSEVFVLLRNTNDDTQFNIYKGMKIAQGVLCEIPDVIFQEIDECELDETSRGSGCLGSTGDY